MLIDNPETDRMAAAIFLPKEKDDMSKWKTLFEKKKENDKKEKCRGEGMELEEQEKYECFNGG